MPEHAPAGVVHHKLPARHLLASGAAAIVEAQRASLPDLSHTVVLVPGLHAATEAARALRAAAGCAILLLPRILTLAQWAAEVPLDRPVLSRAARETLLYKALADRNWLGSADRWAVAGELAALFDELTRNAVALPADLAEFGRELERAYRTKKGNSLNFEARLVHELWHAVARGRDALDPEAAYQLRLARLAQEAAAPLHAIGLGRISKAEERFLERYAARAPVCRIEADSNAADDPVSRTLALAWPRAAKDAHLIDRAAELRSAHAASPLAGRVRLFGAASAEEEAQAVDVTVREWLLAGRQRIAVVVNDRLTARRARALLERAQILVQDEAGWAFSTTSAATVIGRWLDVAGNDCYHRDLLDLMKSPFAFHDWAPDARRRAVWRCETYVREAGVVAGIVNFVRLAEDNNDPEVRQMLARVQHGLGALGQGRRSIARWLQALEASLAEPGVRDGLAADSAGEQLLELLGDLQRELAQDPLAVTFSEWRRWLARQLEAATFRDRSIESPVVFTHLAATPLRSFDGVIILGCDAAHLPGPDPVALFFNQGVRAELGLPVRADELRELEEQLAALIASGGEVLLTWQRTTGGEPNLLSPQLERLVALHRLAYDVDLADVMLAARLPHAEVRSPDAAPLPQATGRPMPAAPAALMPAQISASGYNALMACPYQYYARHLLRLAELDDVQEEIEKKDYGQIVHGVLAGFHRAHPRVSDLEPLAAGRELAALSEEAFAAAVARNYLAQAWLARWTALIPAYLEWQREREAEGWLWHAGETDRRIEIVTPEGRTFMLRGRIDRVDAGPAGAAVIDYKTRSQKALKDALKIPGEDVQLPVYALLWGGPVAAALFLSIEREGVAPVEVDDDIGQLAEATRKRLAQIVDALHTGAPLPAQGVEAACAYCEMRGLCRRNYWP